MMRVPVLLLQQHFASEKDLKSIVIRNGGIYFGQAVKDCCACDVLPKISLFFLHSWRWRMRTLLMYFSNRLEEAVLKWNANSLKNVDTNVFMLIIVFFFFVFISLYFSPFVLILMPDSSQHKRLELFCLGAKSFVLRCRVIFFMCLFTQNG